MTEQDYASQDLKRRPFRTTIVLLSLITVVASTTFLFLFANLMLDVTTTLTSFGLASVLNVFYNTFIWTTLILILLLGVAVISSDISLEIESRRQDIGLMKSIGTLTDTIFDHFMAQAVILLLGGVVLGVAIGTVLYFISLIWIAFAITGVEFVFNFPILQIALLVGIMLVAGYFAAQKPIYDAVHESPISALNPEIGTKVQRIGYLDTFGLPFRIATKGTGRRIKGTRRTIITLFLSFSLASILWIGGGVVETTMDSYLVRSMGENVIAIGNPDLLEEYYESYSLAGEALNDSFSYVDTEDMIPQGLIDDVEEIAAVLQTETRLVDYTTVSEGAAVIWNPTLEQYERIGGDRASSALIIGVDWENTISDWYYEGNEVSEPRDVWLGGEMALTLFEDPLIQSLGLQGASFDVKAIAFDIGNGGNMAIIPISEMQSLWGVEGENLLLVQVNRYTEDTITRVESVASSYGFSVFLQQEILESNLGIIGAYWNLLQPIPIMALVSAFMSLMYYLLISVFSRFRDFVIMRSIGAKPSFIAKTMIAEGIDIGLKAGIPAIMTGIIVSVLFLVPEAAVPSLAYLPATAGLVLIALLIVVVLAAVPVYLLFTSRSEHRVSEFAV
ncbi:MAG: ABC transporter permease [Candidatus Thorarchaeota archaeon]|nr:ABC transporter permease [Candidatus Thorarchaeota archaeon]